MSPALRFVLATLVSFNVASSALGYEVSVATSGTTTAFGGQVLFSGGSTSVGPPGPTSLTDVSGGPVCPAPPVVCLFPWVGHGEASADLSAGTLGVYVSGFHGDADIYASTAGFLDTLVFHLPPGMTSAQVTISMSIDADLPPQNLFGRVTGAALLSFGQDGSGVNFQDLAAPSGPTHFAQVLPVTTTVEDRMPIDVQASLQAALNLVQTDHGTYTFDALHTAALSISVPSGVTYESNSGVFLTQVDEPSLVYLLSSSALGALAAVRPATKRRRMRV